MSYNTTSCPLNISKTELFFSFATSTFIAVLSPVTVAGNALILTAIWKDTFVRTSFHIFLSGLAFTDLCTGLISQPFYVAPTLMCWVNPKVETERTLLITILAIGKSSSVYSISFTVLLITLMSVERWMHMSRRSLVTTRRGFLTVVSLLLSCYLTTSFAYFKVYRIIRHHQLQVQANEASRNSGRQAIDLARFRKSVASMSYIIVLLSFCFIPYVLISAVKLNLGDSLGMNLAHNFSIVLVFLSSTLNPGLYLWRMNDIRNGVKQLFCR